MSERVHAPASREEDERLRASGGGFSATAALTTSLSPQAIVALQRSAGNASVARLFDEKPVQRCACGGTIGADGLCDRCRREAQTLAQHGTPLQRAVAPGPPQPQQQPQQPVIDDPAGVSGTTTGMLMSATLPAGERLCFPPGPIMGRQWGSGFGTLAERFIEQDYCATMGGCSPATEYIDNYNPTAYLAFMTAHNPSLASGAGAVALAAASITGIARPDIMTDNGLRREYYEIKPLSPDGVTAGMTKLIEIMTFMAALSLPYVPGIAYSPSKDIPMWSGMVLGEPLGMALNVQRFLPGLVTYSLCLRGNLSAILAKVALAALLAWLIAELLAGALVLAAA